MPDHRHSQHGPAPATAGAVIDPVCGMTVELDGARTKGLHSNYKDTDYFFCGKGCKLDFDDEPEIPRGRVPAAHVSAALGLFKSMASRGTESPLFDRKGPLIPRAAERRHP